MKNKKSILKRKIVIAMSGGVDSSAAAFLLKEKGYDVFGITMLIWHNENECQVNKSCCSPDDIIDARRIASQLKIPFQTVNFVKEFKNDVMDYFCREYLKGVTPNPCVICNEKMKFGYLLDYAKAQGIDHIATGHYAINHFDDKTGRYAVKKGKDKTKDQSYVLFSLTQGQLKHVVFPLAEYTKEEVRQIAKKNGLITAEKKESQEICFIPDNDYPKFIAEHFHSKEKTGLIFDVNGKRLGRHKGIYHYTIGQRKGLGISSPHPLYVVKIDVEKNEVIVGKDEDLFLKEFIAERVNWQMIDKPRSPILVKAKIRYNFKEEDAKVSILDGDRVRVEFLKPQRAVTPGQAVVFYDKDVVVGGGWIKEVKSGE